MAPLITEAEKKRDLWIEAKREYAEIFQMGRRIWRRPTHPTRLRVVYDLGMLCVRFNDVDVRKFLIFNNFSNFYVFLKILIVILQNKLFTRFILSL